MDTRSRVRLFTAEAHVQVEQQMMLEESLSSRSLYLSLLLRLYEFYVPLEEILSRFDDRLIELALSGRRKVPSLERDIQAIFPQWAKHNRPWPLASELPCIENTAQAYGCLYVVEGATLGGQLISRMLTERLGISPSNGGSFFAGYGSNNGTMWREFVTSLNSFSMTEHDRVQAENAALSTFTALGNWLDGPR